MYVILINIVCIVQCESEEQSEPMCERSASPCSCPETRHHVSVKQLFGIHLCFLKRFVHHTG